MMLGAPVERVPLDDASVMELVPGMVFFISGGSGQQTRFIRIIRAADGAIAAEALGADGSITPLEASPRVFRQAIGPGAMLKHQGFMTDGEWQAFAEFMALVSRWRLDSLQVGQLYVRFLAMAIEREAAEGVREGE